MRITHDQAGQATDLARSIAPLLSGKPAGIVGAALANLVAMLLAGHIVEGDSEETARIRSELLQLHVDTVEKLIPINHDMIHGRRAL